METPMVSNGFQWRTQKHWTYFQSDAPCQWEKHMWSNKCQDVPSNHLYSSLLWVIAWGLAHWLSHWPWANSRIKWTQNSSSTTVTSPQHSSHCDIQRTNICTKAQPNFRYLPVFLWTDDDWFHWSSLIHVLICSVKLWDAVRCSAVRLKFRFIRSWSSERKNAASLRAACRSSLDSLKGTKQLKVDTT